MNKRGVSKGLLSVFMLCVFSLFAFPQNSAALSNCPETMTSYWKLDTEEGNPYINEIDTDYNGEHIGVAPALNAEGAVDGAQDFDGSTTGIDIPASGTSQAPFDWEATDSFTIELWVKRAAGIAGNEVAVGRDNGDSTMHWWIGLDANGPAAFGLYDLGGNGLQLNGTTNLADGEWHHIVAVRDADLGKNLLYVDGELEDSADFTYNPGDEGFKSSTASLNIGWLNLNPFYHFDGAIDEVALYNVALNERLINRHYERMGSYCEIYLFSAPGVFRKGNWYLDANGNGAWDAGADTSLPLGNFGLSTDIPITGDWNGDGEVNIGVFRKGAWYLDYNGNGIWDPNPIDPEADKTFPKFGLATDIPVTGDWDGDGKTEIGVFRGGKWYLDFDGDGQWDVTFDKVGTFGLKGDIPITGDWNGDGTTNIGVFRSGNWFLDADNDYAWDKNVDTKIASPAFGLSTDKPVTGDWNGDGFTNIGVYRDDKWFLDFDGDNAWNKNKDIALPAKSFGLKNDKPITGFWPIIEDK